ncbi:MAG: hypothetical protein ACXAEF_05730 [Candidatus Thorarchaeota archaeon]
MKDPCEYNITSYGLFLQNEKRDFGGLISEEVHVSAIITCHPEENEDFKKVYLIFINDEKVPNFKYPDHIRDDDAGDKCAYIFRPYSEFHNYVDLLRYEKPITLWWSKKEGIWQLATGRAEPVGEAIER